MLASRFDLIAIIDYNECMPSLTIRNLSQEAHDALRRRAAENRRSMEAEARSLIEDAASEAPPPPVDMERLRELQERIRKAVGGDTTGMVDQFLRERAADWGE